MLLFKRFTPVLLGFLTLAFVSVGLASAGFEVGPGWSFPPVTVSPTVSPTPIVTVSPSPSSSPVVTPIPTASVQPTVKASTSVSPTPAPTVPEYSTVVALLGLVTGSLITVSVLKVRGKNKA